MLYPIRLIQEISVLKHISDTLDKIFEFISKPPSKWTQIFNTAVAREIT